MAGGVETSLAKDRLSGKSGLKEERKKKTDSFVLDVNSLMTEILASSGSEEEEEDNVSLTKPANISSLLRDGKKMMNGAKSPEPAKTTPQGKTRKLETVTSSTSVLVVEKDAGAPERPSHSTSPRSTGSKPPPTSERNDLASSRRDSETPAVQEIFSKNKPPPSPSRRGFGRREFGKTAAVEEPLTDEGISTRSKEREGVKPGSSTMNGLIRDEGKSVESKTEDSYKLRSRANALAGKRQSSIDVGGATAGKMEDESQKRNSDQFDENSLNEPTAGYRSRTGSSKDVKRSGSFNLRRQMSGDKALGIFYHNRRSQMMEGGDDQAASDCSLERSGSHSSPQSPQTGRASRGAAASRGGIRDSGDQGAVGNKPVSPLLNSSANSDTLGEGLRNFNARGNERAESGGKGAYGGGEVPTSPRILVNNMENGTEVSQGRDSL